MLGFSVIFFPNTLEHYLRNLVLNLEMCGFIFFLFHPFLS